jgi:hypothetical protein
MLKQKARRTMHQTVSGLTDKEYWRPYEARALILIFLFVSLRSVSEEE